MTVIRRWRRCHFPQTPEVCSMVRWFTTCLSRK